MDTEQAALAAEKQAMAVYAGQVATAVNSGCSNSDASNAATGADQGPPGDAAYALQSATDDLSKAGSALTDAINAVNPPPCKIAASISQAALSADSDLASRVTTTAQQDAALASADKSGIFTQSSNVWNLPYS